MEVDIRRMRFLVEVEKATFGFFRRAVDDVFDVQFLYQLQTFRIFLVAYIQPRHPHPDRVLPPLLDLHIVVHHVGSRHLSNLLLEMQMPLRLRTRRRATATLFLLSAISYIFCYGYFESITLLSTLFLQLSL